MKTFANLMMLATILFNNLPLNASIVLPAIQGIFPVASITVVTTTPSVTTNPPTQESATLAPVITETGVPTVTPTGMVTLEPSPTLKPTITSTPLPSVTPTTLVTPTATPTLEPGSEEPVGVSLTSSSEFITPGGQTTIHWDFEQQQVSRMSLDGYELVFTLSPGVNIRENTKGVYDAETHTYRIPASKIGEFHLDVDENAEMPIYVDAQLLQSAEQMEVAKGTLALVSKSDVAQSGGIAEGLNGKVKVTFPDGVLPENAEVFIHRPLREAMPPHSLTGKPFEITARGKTSGEKLNKFSDAIEIEFSYADLGIPAEQASSLCIYYYDTESQGWVAIPTVVDGESGKLHGYTTHFTVFDIKMNNWQASRMPTVDNFQVSEFTGAATFNYPITLPSGPGGWQPSVSLSYNSQVVDQTLLDSQSSWAGMGWSVDVGSIERDTHGTLDFAGDDSYYLNLNGVSSQIILGTDDLYHLADENFMRIWLVGSNIDNDSRWIVWDKEGNVFTFSPRLANYQPKYCTDGGLTKTMYRWVLTEARNKFGQRIIYVYEDEVKTLSYYQYNAQGNCSWTGSTSIATASYLKNIIYALADPNDTTGISGRYKVTFGREDRDVDYDVSWVNDGVYHSFERSRLATITVKKDDDANGSFEIIRTYRLTHGPVGYIFNALTSITEYNSVDSSLPPYTFTYGDGKHLTQASNGYGGSVLFTYGDPWIYEGGGSYSWNSGYSCNNNQSSWGGATLCDMGLWPQPRAEFRGKAEVLGSVVWDGALPPVRPGGNYKLTLYGDAGLPIDPNGLDIRLGLEINPGSNMIDRNGLVASGYNQIPNSVYTIIQVPQTAYSIWPYIYVDGSASGKAHFGAFTIDLLPTFYRVMKKTISDSNGHSYDFNYTYEGPVVNDPAHSSLVCTPGQANCYGYVKTYSEFRGHAKVTVTAPDGRKDVTEFYQGDVTKGKPKTVTVTDVNGKLLSQTTYSYDKDYLSFKLPLHTTDGKTWDTKTYIGLYYRFVYQTKQEQRTYNYDGVTYNTVRSMFAYDHAYGNQTEQVEYPCSEVESCSPYRTTETGYMPSATTDTYLVGLPADQAVCSGGGYGPENPCLTSSNLLSKTLYLYDTHTNYTIPPTQGILTAMRTWVDDVNYAQIDYEYVDDDNIIRGNRTKVTTYSDYASQDTSPSSTGAHITKTIFDPVYHVYPISETNHLNQTTTWAYDLYGYGLGLPNKETDPNGQYITATYDYFGRMASLSRPGDEDSPSMKFTYVDEFPYRAVVQQRINGGLYYVMRHYYDGMGRQYMVETGSKLNSNAFVKSTTTLTDYTSWNIVKQSAPYDVSKNETPSYTTTTKDERGRPTRVDAPDGTYTTYSYNGLITTVTDPKSYPTTTIADVWGRTKSVTPPTGPGVTYDYDTLGNLLTVRRGVIQNGVIQNGSVTTMTYDKAGHKLSMTDPDMGNWSYTYDALGNLKTQTDARGCILTLTYDALNRLTEKHSIANNQGCQNVPAVDVTYYYDGQIFTFQGTQYGGGNNTIGRRTGMMDGSGIATWNYDTRGRVTSEIKLISGQSFTTSTTYNSADLPLSMTYPDGEVMTYTYNPLMLLETVTGTKSGSEYDYVSATSYDSASRIKSRTIGYSLTQTYTYYGWSDQPNGIGQGGRLHTLTTVNSQNVTLQNLSYVYNKAGDVKSITGNDETQTFTYDSIDRLTSWTLTPSSGTPTTDSYGYNTDTGNLVTKSGVITSYPTGNNPARPHAATSTDNGTATPNTSDDNTYTYDANGNQDYRHIATGLEAGNYNLTYDFENRLVEVKKNTVTIAKFTYDGDGKRVKSEIGTGSIETTLFVGNYFEQKGSEVTKYYYAGSQAVAVRKVVVPQTQTLNYLAGDHLGSTSLVTDTAGALVAETRYKPWGEVRYTTANTTLPTRYTYTGQYSYVSDDATDLAANTSFGLMYYNARWYDPYNTHFTSPDTIIPDPYNPLDYSRYAYARYNPLKYTDPSGHTAQFCNGAALVDGEQCKAKLTPITILARFGVKLTNGTANWDKRDALAALTAVVDVAIRMGADAGLTAIEAFRTAYRTYNRALEFRKVTSYTYNGVEYTAGGFTQDSHTILFAGLSQQGGTRSYALAFQNAQNNIVHELGHAFARNWPSSNIDTVPDSLRNEQGWPASPINAQLLWRQHPCRWDGGSCYSGEVYADMFLGWTYNTWGNDALAPDRTEFMTNSMNNFWYVPGE